MSDETPAAAIPAGGVARKHAGYVMLLLKTATAALLLRAHVQSAFQMGESGVENRRNMQRGCAGPLLNPESALREAAGFSNEQQHQQKPSVSRVKQQPPGLRANSKTKSSSIRWFFKSLEKSYSLSAKQHFSNPELSCFFFQMQPLI